MVKKTKQFFLRQNIAVGLHDLRDYRHCYLLQKVDFLKSYLRTEFLL
jgi:hypothetical protein